VVLALVALNALVFCAQALSDAHTGVTIAAYGLIPARFFHWGALGGVAYDPWRFLPIGTSMFLHDGWLHLCTNMIYLWTFGRALEGRLGRVGVGATYLLAGIAAALGQLIAHPRSSAAMIGASGAIAGLLGAYLVSFPRAEVTVAFPFYMVPFVLRVRALWFLLAWLALQVGQGVADLFVGTTDPQVAWWAHTTGFVTGTVGAIAGRVWQPAASGAPRTRITFVPPAPGLRPSVPVLARSSAVPSRPP
jgi:membrane associated rhomboid family serine protease